MRDLDLIAAYAASLEEALRRAGRPTQPLVAEATEHLLEDAARIARDEGCSDGEAARRAIARFGDVASVVAASRRYGRTLAASVARISSIVLLVVLAWDVFTDVFDRGLELGDFLLVFWFMFCDLGLVTWFMFRALRGRGRAGILPIVLALNGALAAALLSTDLAVDVRQRLVNLQHVGPGVLLLLQPEWLLMVVQSAAGLWALRANRTREGELVRD